MSEGDLNSVDETSAPDVSHFLVAVEDEPDTVDFQCTSIHYTIAQNVFNRLVETENDQNGNMEILPSLARSWEISPDGRQYTFHLQEDVTFSNGSPLTSSDVKYTFERLLTHPDSCNQDIVDIIQGARELESGEAQHLEGLKIIDDHSFTIILERPFEAFLACMSMPAASILDEETTTEAGDRFGTDPDWTIGTGSFVLWKWDRGDGMLLTANKYCWQGTPRCEGLDLRFATDAGEIRRMFEKGEIDVLDLDETGNFAEYFKHGKQYQDRLFKVQRIGITYIALNEKIAPLNDVRVRKAMQLSLNRPLLLAAVYGDSGLIENGIFPHGLYGYNPDLPEIPYDPDAAKKLLKEAGYTDGFDLTVSVNSASTRWELSVMRIAASMWEKIGIRVTVDVIDESEFMGMRKSGKLACYTAQWMADFNDPDNFIYTFFGNSHNTTFRSLCYPKETIMERIRKARTIPDRDERIREYQDLERIIVQEDAAWIPLYSRQRYYVTSERLEGIQASWNGSVKNKYREMSINYQDEN
jgi:ABC-type transport system substrate-binding protein